MCAERSSSRLHHHVENGGPRRKEKTRLCKTQHSPEFLMEDDSRSNTNTTCALQGIMAFRPCRARCYKCALTSCVYFFRLSTALWHAEVDALKCARWVSQTDAARRCPRPLDRSQSVIVRSCVFFFHRGLAFLFDVSSCTAFDVRTFINSWQSSFLSRAIENAALQWRPKQSPEARLGCGPSAQP